MLREDNKRFQKGLTILELIVVVLVLVLSARLAGLGLSKAIHGRQLKRSAYEVMALIDNYAEIAVHAGADIDLWFSTSSKRLIAVKRYESSTVELGQHQVLAAGIILIKARFGNVGKNRFHVLTVRPDGSATPGRFVLASSDRRKCDIIQALRGGRRIKCVE